MPKWSERSWHDARVPLRLRESAASASSYMSPRDLEGLMVELRMKGERFYEAVQHPGEGKKTRHVMGERDLEDR